MSNERKFKAAVNVIRSLPKNGAYQPSADLMLRFYAYYKQATEGPNKIPKPGFWDVVNRAKWNAWNKLGNMPKEEAMMNYVDELKKIVETMSYTDNVATFLTSLDSFYESVPIEDLEMLIGPVIDRVQSQPGSPLSGSPLGSRESSPHRLKVSATFNSGTSATSSISASPLSPDTDDEEEDFVDTVEQEEPERPSRKKQPAKIAPVVNGECNNVSPDFVKSSLAAQEPQVLLLPETEKDASEQVPLSHSKDVSSVMRLITDLLRRDLDDALTRVAAVELKLYKKECEQKQMKKMPVWWPFAGLPKQTIAFLVIWPFIVTLLLHYVRRR